jgi:hypothetical protein
MVRLRSDDPVAAELVEAIRGGDVQAVERLVGERPELAPARIVDDKGGACTPLHVATDWPGHFPNGPAVIALLVRAGADPNAPVEGSWHAETPLHWAASSDDVQVAEALLDAGADIEAPGASIGGGTPLDDAVGYGQWPVARRLVERGGPDPAVARGRPGADGSPRRGLRAHPTTHVRAGHRGLLAGLSRRAAWGSRVPAGLWRRPQLGPRLGPAHAAGHGPRLGRAGPGRMAARPGRQIRRRAWLTGGCAAPRCGGQSASVYGFGRMRQSRCDSGFHEHPPIDWAHGGLGDTHQAQRLVGRQQTAARHDSAGFLGDLASQRVDPALARLGATAG